MAALEAKGDLEAADRLRAEMGEIEKAIEDVDYRAANIRAGYVYVISNLGAFGERMVKVGMTRRLEPLDRIRELSDASVPFNFDVHAIHFSNDAVGVEAEMHRRLADRRVNRVNLRREFFYATPAEVRSLLSAVAGDLLEFTESAEAFEYHQSVNESGSEPVAP
ncbi:GIY-YIG nuclease family protein [Kribbella sp. ALI-6-A]|uniref:GIY-YIG nuclease family protein n=1 Tax=Kribbella sp. ALI-6-A TaxID=1933817 RepID=UPI001EDB77CC|nr:GIY-YIG nuclease family protein [Kribbella sp. ALI-6-A]